VRSAPTYLNPLKEREISLRGFKIPTIENLGVTEDQFDSIDLSDNEIIKLDNMPLLPRLQTLLLHNNRIMKIAEGLYQFIPKLTNLMLSHNKITSIEAITSLTEFKRLTCLSLLNNPIVKHPQYRMAVIHLLPQLKTLDFHKIKQKEREDARRLFGDKKEKKEKDKKEKESQYPSIIGSGSHGENKGKTKTFTPGEGIMFNVPVTSMDTRESEIDGDASGQPQAYVFTLTLRKLFIEKVKNATSLAEIDRLEKVLSSNKITADIVGLIDSHANVNDLEKA